MLFQSFKSTLARGRPFDIWEGRGGGGYGGFGLTFFLAYNGGRFFFPASYAVKD